MRHPCKHPRQAVVAALLGGLAFATWAAAAEPSRGELLYATHCIECHNEQIHWREHKLARDWPTLRVEVDRWQQAARLGWSGEDIDAVARHLNQSIYGFPAPVVSLRGNR